uniref:CUB domain-containing protein n=1 Tax=Clytia hemisphaerica TaxID=252671 RepID=A0A7M5XA83_9CNID
MICFLLLLYLVDFSASKYVDPSKDIQPECLHYFNVTKEGVFSTPDYPNAYPPLKKCGWIINHSPNDADININFHDFELEKFPRCYKSDYMTIYRDQGTGKWEQIGSMSGYCGELPNFLISTSARQILVKF